MLQVIRWRRLGLLSAGIAGVLLGAVVLLARVDAAERSVDDAIGAGVAADEPGGQSELQLSLEDAVLGALENNPALQAERLEPVVAGTFERIERGDFDVGMFAEGSYSLVREERIDPSTSARFDLERDAANLSVGLRQSLPFGADWEVALGQSFEETESGGQGGGSANGGEELHTTHIGLNFTQQLLRGRGREVNLVGVRQAEIGVMSSEYELRGFMESLIADVESAYWDYVLADREIELYKESLRLATEEIERARERVRVGDLARTELPALEAERALRRQELIDARNRRQVASLELLRLSGTEQQLDEEIQINPTTEPERSIAELAAVADHLALALERRPELNQARLDLQSDNLQVTRTRNGVLPRLELFVSLGRSGYADSFSSAPRQLDEPNYDAELGIRLERPLRNRAPRAEHEQALAQRNQASLSINNLARLVRHDVRSAYLEVERAQSQIDASQATRQAQQERVRAEEERFRAGEATSFAVVQAQRDLLESQINEAGALVDYRQALLELYRLDGTLLERRGINAAALE
ncbi:type I secretion system [Halorhodospira halochloris]|uniref:Type I secretion system n=1 Tax=Halorhodospira halochloris TaxID=1052 RepID=A0A120MZS7_HALHR|nr:type I secretion system [Halorhodospira halochloris]